MKVRFIATALVAALMASGVSAHDVRNSSRAHAHPDTRSHSHANKRVVTQQVRINCFRGPIRETVWDHARSVFIEDLVSLGYNYDAALAIATRICRDVTAVGNPDALRANLLNAIAKNPPGHSTKH